MKRILMRLVRGERGTVLPLSLMLLATGSLWVIPGITYATGNLNHHRIISSAVKGTYAADAAVENTLWYLKRDQMPPAGTITVNGMTVTTQVTGEGVYTLYLSEMVGNNHPYYLSIAGSIVQDGPPDRYKYTITVTWQAQNLQGQPTIHLNEVGARLPPGYIYQAGSAALFGDNLEIQEPTITEDQVGAQIANWELTSNPSVSKNDRTATETFYVNGTGNADWHYEWVVANRTDVGLVGDVTGSLWVITATATRPNSTTVTGKVVVNALKNGTTIYIPQWQIVR